MAYIPKGYFRAGRDLRLYIRAKEPDRFVPDTLDNAIEQFERLAHLAMRVDDARKLLGQASRAGSGLDPRKQGQGSLAKLKYAQAELDEALDNLREALKYRGPGIASRGAK